MRYETFSEKQGALLLKWFNFDPSGNYIRHKGWNEIIQLLANFNGATVEVWEWVSNFIPHFTTHVITYVETKVKLCK